MDVKQNHVNVNVAVNSNNRRKQMLKKIVLGLLLTSSLFAENELWKFFKYSTAYASFSLNAPRYQDDKFAIVGGLSTGDLVVERDENQLEADFQKSI